MDLITITAKLLSESIQVLREYDAYITIQKIGEKLRTSLKKDPTYSDNKEDLNSLFVKLDSFDPTPRKEYVVWMANLYAKGNTKFEDLSSTIPSLLTKYHKLKQKNILKPEHKDISRLDGVALYDVVNSYNLPEEKQEAVKGKSSVFYEDKDIKVIVPEDEAAAKYYGRGTKWCTAADKNCQYSNYAESGKLYIILLKTERQYDQEKYQFHFESGSFMNDKDQQVELLPLVVRYPSLVAAFHNVARQHREFALLKNGRSVVSQWEDILEDTILAELTLSTAELGSVATSMMEIAENLGEAEGLKGPEHYAKIIHKLIVKYGNLFLSALHVAFRGARLDTSTDVLDIIDRHLNEIERIMAPVAHDRLLVSMTRDLALGEPEAIFYLIVELSREIQGTLHRAKKNFAQQL